MSLSLNRAALERYMIGFRGVISPDGNPINLKRSKVYRQQEAYKYDVAKEASERLYSAAWQENDIGRGDIYECVNDALGKSRSRSLIKYSYSSLHVDSTICQNMDLFRCGSARTALRSR